MNAAELERARKPANISRLLTRVETRLSTDYQCTSYNYLIEFLEFPEWFGNAEGERLIGLCLEVLVTLSKARRTAT